MLREANGLAQRLPLVLGTGRAGQGPHPELSLPEDLGPGKFTCTKLVPGGPGWAASGLREPQSSWRQDHV